LELHKMPDEEIQFFRSIEVIPSRSYIRQFGRRFNIVHGKITFDGPIAEMRMDVGAEFEVRSRGNPGQPEAIISLTLSGPIDDLKLVLGSEPQMSNTDIVSYIATGKPASEALRFGGNDQGGFLSQGGALAAGELASIVEGVAAEGLGLDVIEIQQDGLRGTRIVAGKYVSPRLYLGVSQPIALSSTVGTGSAPTGTQPTEATVEYEVFDWLLLRLLSGTSGSSMHFNLAGRYAF
jgi:translocation and assembly module TamB